MRIETIPININPKITGQTHSGEAANLQAYILDSLQHSPEKSRPGIILMPGGGYSHLSDRENQPIVMKFLGMGYHVFVLSYSLAPNHFPVQLMELAKAIALARERAGEWHVDPEQILVCGFSAGGHLAGSLGVHWNKEWLYGPLGLQPEQIRPNGMILCYPVITSGEKSHRGSFQMLLGEEAENPEQMELVSLEKQVGPHVPKTFLWHTDTDGSVPVENSLLFAMALKQYRVGMELHIYPRGPHGLSLATEEVSTSDRYCVYPQCQNWIDLVDVWIRHEIIES